MRRLQLVLAVGIGLVGGTVLCLLQPGVTAMSSSPQKGGLPGVTAKDPFPKGCVSCHIKTPKGDERRLSADIRKVKGHPDVSQMMKVIPKDCAMCHKGGPKPAPINTAIHKAHYSKQSASLFVKQFGGSCLACHAMDAKTGAVTVKSGPKNW